MRFALWLIGLFGVAVAIALFAGSNPGTVTLFWPPYRVDFSLNLVLLMLFGAFVTLHLALRALAALFALPNQARQWRAQQRDVAAHHAFADALSHLMAGRFTRAGRAARLALARQSAREEGADDDAAGAPLRCLSHWLLAESAHALRDPVQRDAQFALALSLAAASGSTREGLLLRAAQWRLDDGAADAALAQLDALPPTAARRLLARRLRLAGWRRSGRAPPALDAARGLARRHALSGDDAQRLVPQLRREALADAADAARLQALFDRLPPAERALPGIALFAAERLQALGGSPAVARGWLLSLWDSMMAPGGGGGGDDPERIRLVRALAHARESADPAFEPAWRERIEMARRRSPQDPLLRHLAGLVCLQQPEMAHQAAQLLELALRDLHDPKLRRNAWRGLARLAERRGDRDAAADAWRHAAEALNR